MTIWHVQKLYSSEGAYYQVLPYNLEGILTGAMKMKHGIWRVIKFLLDSRLREKAAYSLCEKKNSKMK